MKSPDFWKLLNSEFEAVDAAPVIDPERGY
jgi:hypothetical protein